MRYQPQIKGSKFSGRCVWDNLQSAFVRSYVSFEWQVYVTLGCRAVAGIKMAMYIPEVRINLGCVLSFLSLNSWAKWIVDNQLLDVYIADGRFVYMETRVSRRNTETISIMSLIPAIQ